MSTPRDAAAPRAVGQVTARRPGVATSSTQPRAADPDGTLTGSAALSLLDLRRHLVRRAGELRAQARAARARGDAATAARLAQQANALSLSAQRMGRH